ncbi:MAG: hypothetical protein B7X46_02775 [Thiomonas sp. 15-66-11]|nr:MAG: hypothetical protein B7X46_02775 [Thiomonas sp. 15-66-11]
MRVHGRELSVTTRVRVSSAHAHDEIDARHGRQQPGTNAKNAQPSDGTTLALKETPGRPKFR